MQPGRLREWPGGGGRVLNKEVIVIPIRKCYGVDGGWRSGREVRIRCAGRCQQCMTHCSQHRKVASSPSSGEAGQSGNATTVKNRRNAGVPSRQAIVLSASAAVTIILRTLPSDAKRAMQGGHPRGYGSLRWAAAHYCGGGLARKPAKPRRRGRRWVSLPDLPGPSSGVAEDAISGVFQDGAGIFFVANVAASSVLVVQPEVTPDASW